MHPDIAPAVLVPKLGPNTSIIFHHKHETPHVRGYQFVTGAG